MREKSKISMVLFFLILLLLGVIFFLLNRWSFLSAFDIFSKIPTTKTSLFSSTDSNSISDLDFIEFEKKKEKILIEQSKLKEERQEIDMLQQEIHQERIKLIEERKSLEFREKKLKYEQRKWKDKNEKIDDLAKKIRNMPPKSVYEMLNHWDDFDIIDVFRRIDQNAEKEGENSITAYLLTLFSSKRSAVLTEKMLLPEFEE